MPEKAREEDSDITGFWDKAGLRYLENVLRALERGSLAIEYLRSRWSDMMGDERRMKYLEAEAALDTADHYTRAVTEPRGLTPKLDEKLDAAVKKRDAAGNTKQAKIAWLLERGGIYNSMLMEANVILTPQTSAADIVSTFLANLFEVSEPLYTDGEEKLADEDFEKLVAERIPRIMGAEIEEPVEEEEPADEDELDEPVGEEGEPDAG